jgi:RNA polymerase sigma factor (sigma-70 family)
MTSLPPSNSTEDAFATRWSRIQRLHDEGAEDAWRWFIERYYPEIRTMLGRRVPSQLAAQAEAEFWGYLFVSRAVTRAERERRFRPYLAGVVRNFARSWLRRHVGSATSDGQLEQIAASASHEFEQEELRAWARRTVTLALDSMAKKYPTQTAVLRLFYGLSDGEGQQVPVAVAEIAARLDKSIAAIHQDLTRGRLRLRECIEGDLRDQSGSAEDWRAEMQLIFGALDTDRPGLIPK